MMETELQELKELIAHKLHFVEQRPSVVRVTGLQPLVFASTSYPEVLGINNIPPAAGQLPKDTALVLFHFQGKGIAGLLSNLGEIMALSGLTETVAALNDRLILLDDQVFAVANEVQQLEILAEVCYPKFFAFGHEGLAWAKLNL